LIVGGAAARPPDHRDPPDPVDPSYLDGLLEAETSQRRAAFVGEVFDPVTDELRRDLFATIPDLRDCILTPDRRVAGLPDGP